MSYILDALRKAEREQSTNTPPGVSTPAPAASVVVNPGWTKPVLVIAALTILVLLALLTWQAVRTSPQATPAQQAKAPDLSPVEPTRQAASIQRTDTPATHEAIETVSTPVTPMRVVVSPVKTPENQDHILHSPSIATAASSAQTSIDERAQETSNPPRNSDAALRTKSNRSSTLPTRKSTPQEASRTAAIPPTTDTVKTVATPPPAIPPQRQTIDTQKPRPQVRETPPVIPPRAATAPTAPQKAPAPSKPNPSHAKMFNGHVLGIKSGCHIEAEADKQLHQIALSSIQCPSDPEFAKKARSLTTRAVFNREIQVIVWSRSEQGILSADVRTRDGYFLNAKLVEAGLAWGQSPAMRRLEEKARQLKTGMWEEL